MKAIERACAKRPTVLGWRMQAVIASVYWNMNCQSECLQARDASDQGPDDRRIGMILARKEPVARPLKDGELGRLFCHRGYELNCTCARADDPNTLAFQRVVVIPSRGVKRASHEPVESLQGRIGGFVQLTGRQHDRIGLVGATVGGCNRPAPALLIPFARNDLAVWHKQAIDTVVASYLL